MIKGSLFALVLFVLVSCGTQPNINELVNDMVVLTDYDNKTNFSAYTTYQMPLDTIGLISNTGGNQYLLNDYSKLITSAIKKNMDKTNRTMVDKDADLGVNVFVVYDYSVYATPSYYPGYYGGYGGGYYGYYGYGYGYAPVYSYQSSQSALLVIELIDVNNSTQSNNKVVWTANIGDLISSYDPSKKVEEAINQAFAQSEFLKR